MPFGTSNVYPNLYVKIVGPAGCRKSTGIRKVRKLLQEATEYSSFAFEQTSKEKFVTDLATGGFVQSEFGDAELDSILNAEVFIVADEFNDFIGQNNIQFCSLLGQLWDYDGVYKPSFKTSGTLVIRNPTITILGGNTHAALQDAFPAHLIGQGFTSRIIFVAATHPGKKIAWPENKSQDFASFRRNFNEISALAHNGVELSEKIKALIERIYLGYKPLQDSRLAHYCSRRHMQLLKLIVGATLADSTLKVSEAHVIYANSLLAFAESRMSAALGEYGNNRNSAVAMRILAMLRDPPGTKLSTKELWAGGCSQELDDFTKFGDQLHSLQVANKIKLDKSTSKWVAVSAAEECPPYVDYSLLPELYTEKIL